MATVIKNPRSLWDFENLICIVPFRVHLFFCFKFCHTIKSRLLPHPKG